MRMRTRKLALMEGIAAGMLFGTAAVFIRFLQDVDAFSIAFWRLIIACLVLASMLIVFRRSFRLGTVQKNFKHLLILGFFLSLHFVFFVSAVKDTTILNATVLVNTTPIFSVFVSSFLFKIKPSRMAILGLAVSFIGVLAIAYAEAVFSGASVQWGGFSLGLKGDLEAVLAALVESFYLNYGRKLRGETGLLPTMLPIYLLAAAFVGLLSLPMAGTVLASPSQELGVFALIGLGILPTAVAHTLYFSSLSNLKSFETATMALLEPIGATMLGIVLFQEIPAMPFVFGALLILLGVFFVVQNRN